MGRGNLRGKAAVDGNRVKLILEVHEAVAPGVEQNFLAVGRPARHVFLGRMIGQSPRHAARGGNHVDIAIAVVFTGERDHRTVGRKVGQSLDADSGGEAARIAAVAADDPEIIRSS